MNPLFEKIIFLLAGGIAGSLATSFILKPKYEAQIEQLEDTLDRYENDQENEARKTRQAVLEGLGVYEKDDGTFAEYDDENDENDEKLEKISKHIVKKVKQAKEKPDMKTIIHDNGYAEDKEDDTPNQNEVIDEKDDYPFEDDEDIEIITEEDIEDYPDYDREELYYTRDKVLVDDQGNRIEDVDEYVGYDSLHQFEQYDDNVVYVRNHRIKSNISIFREPKTYKEFKEA